MSITRERLKELINNRQPLWSFAYYMDGTKDVCRFNPKAYHIDNDNDMMRYNYGDELYIKFEDLFEIEEDAKFALRYKRIPHTEYLDLPTWKEIKNKENYKITFWVKDKYYDFLCNWNSYRSHHYLSITENYMVDEEWCWVNLLEKSFDESNYLFACEICRKLFLGESV